MGGAILPHLAGREKALPKRLWSHRGGVRGETEGTDPPDESGNRRPPLRGQHGVPRRGKPQEESHRCLPAGASRCDQQGHDRQRAERGSLHGAAVLRRDLGGIAGRGYPGILTPEELTEVSPQILQGCKQVGRASP